MNRFQPIFDSDSCPAIVVKSERVDCQMEAGLLRGPKPVLFAWDPVAARANLKEDSAVVWPGRFERLAGTVGGRASETPLSI